MSQRPFSNSFPRRLNPSARSSFFRDFPLDDEDMFFESNPTSWDFPSSQLGGSIFDTFPRRSTMRSSFPSHHFEGASSGSHDRAHDPFASRWHHPSWVDDELRRSRGSSPSPMDRMDSRRSPTPPNPPSAGPRSGSGSPGVNSQSFFGRNDGFPIKVVHEGSSRTPSRSSTPSSNAGETNHEASCESPTVPPPGVEKFPGVTSKTHSNAYSARRQPKVHHIPIHVEPRDEGHPTAATPPQSHPEPRDIRLGSQSDSASPSASPRQQRRASHGQSSKKTGVPRVIPVKMDTSKSQTVPPSTDRLPTPEHQARAASPAPPRKTPLTLFEVIEGVLQAVHEMEHRVAAFSGTRTDKEYLFIDEMLTRNLIKLDNIETDGNSDLRQARKAAIHEVNTLIHTLEANVIKESQESVENMEMDVFAAQADGTVGSSQSGTGEVVSEPSSTAAASQEVMESDISALPLPETKKDSQLTDAAENCQSSNTQGSSGPVNTVEGAAAAPVANVDASCPTDNESTKSVTASSEQSTTAAPTTEDASKMDCNTEPADSEGAKREGKPLFKTSVELQVTNDHGPSVPNGDATLEEQMQACT